MLVPVVKYFEARAAKLVTLVSSGAKPPLCWDLSIIELCKKYKIPFHISTQASVSNKAAAKFYKKLGAERVVLARELNLKRKDLWESRDEGVRKSIKNRDMPGINKFPQHEPDKSYKESPEDNNILEKHKPGYCYIGTDRGYRSCIKVKRKDDCESKKIFPTMDICINPSLRQ